MGRTKRLSARYVATVAKPGMHADGDGLYLVVTPAGSKRWTFIFQWHGKRAEMGLGRLAAVPLLDAREAAAQARQLVAKGINPIAERDSAKTAARLAGVTFGAFADSLIDDLAPQFRNPKHIAQWRMSLLVYCASLRPRQLDAIETEDVLAVLKPLWQAKPETASRVRGRIERVLDAAKVAGHRSGENPARWRGHLDAILPKRQKLTRGHHAALPYADLPAFMVRLRDIEGLGARALELTILCVTRTAETIGARWSEINLDGAVWTIPAKRMKAGRVHRIALSGKAVELLRELHEARTSEFVFPGLKRGTHISNATMTKALNSAGGDAVTVHGFRSSFRDWVGEETSFADAVAEAALAHIVGDETERAYRRADALEKRRTMMQAWAGYVLPDTTQNVVPIKRKRATAA